MKEASSITLSDLIKNIDSYNDEGTVYLEKKWNQDAKGFLIVSSDREDDLSMKYQSAEYFLEMNLIKEVLEVFYEWHGNSGHNIKKLCKAVIYYAENDSYLD